MENDENSFRRFLGETKEKAKTTIEQSHVSAEIRTVIADLLQLLEQFDQIIRNRSDGKSDQRLLAKRMEALKVEHRTANKRLENLKEILTVDIGPILKSISTEASALDQLAEKLSDSTLKNSAGRIKMALLGLIEAIKKM